LYNRRITRVLEILHSFLVLSSILGSIEPDCLVRSLPRGGDAQAARFLYAWPNPSPFRPLADRKPLRNEAVLSLLRRLQQAIDTSSEPHVLVADRSAAATFDVFLARLGREIRQAEGLETAWLGRGRGAVACLAGTFSLLRWSAGNSDEPPQRIGLESLEHVVALWSDCYRQHARAFLQRVLPADLECGPAGSCVGCVLTAAASCREKTCGAQRSARRSMRARPIAFWGVSSVCCAGCRQINARKVAGRRCAGRSTRFWRRPGA
jgi:hypothetical protein